MFVDCLNCGRQIQFDEEGVQVGDGLQCSQCGNDYILESISPVKIFSLDDYFARSKSSKHHKNAQMDLDDPDGLDDYEDQDFDDDFDYDDDDMDSYDDEWEPKRKTRKPWNRRNSQKSSYNEDMQYYKDF
jgi:hypothetical protein